MKYHIRVYEIDGLSWRETFATDDFDDALATWAAECEYNPVGNKFSGRVELVEENILEVQDP
jgi:hypothetical protein